MREDNIQVSQLRLDLNNYRIGRQEGQREAIRAIIDDQKDDLIETASDIIAIGLSPAERLIVIEDEEEPGFYIVLEGNRRTTALKILEWPDHAAGTPYHRAFKALARKFEENPVREVKCVVAEDRAEARPWIERRHNRSMGGRGLKQWNPRAKDNFDAEGSILRPSKSVVDWLKKLEALSAETDKALDRKTSTMDRVFDTGGFGDVLGIRIAPDGTIGFDNGDVTAGTALLRRIVEDMARPKWTVNDVRSVDQRRAYIRSFKPWAVTVSDDEPQRDTGQAPAEQDGITGGGTGGGSDVDGGGQPDAGQPPTERGGLTIGGPGGGSDVDGGSRPDAGQPPAEQGGLTGGGTGGGSDTDGGSLPDAGQPPTERGGLTGGGTGGGSDADGGRRPDEGQRTGERPDDAEGRGDGDTEDGASEDRNVGSGKKPKERKDTLDRKTLAPTRRDLLICIDNKRLNRIYQDAKKINIDKHANAASFVMRAFVEMSIEEYLERKEIAVPGGLASKAKSWDKARLFEKAQGVLDDLDPKGSVKTFEPVRKALKDKDVSGSVHTMHAYVHNREFEPSPDALKRAWEAWEGFLRALHDAI